MRNTNTKIQIQIQTQIQKYKNTNTKIQKRVLCHQKEDVWVGGCASKTGQKQEAPHLQPPAALLQITVRSKDKKNERKGKNLLPV